MTAKLIRTSSLNEGEVFCKWLRNRLLIKNKNVLGAELGATGSGKSYRDLRKVEIWYKEYLQRDFNTENICFGVLDAMKRLNSGELKKGDIIIFEEAGANLGSLDFQNKMVKMFSYVLQSFRSMNIGIFFNLPYLSMLNKQSRLLLHYSSESMGIDEENKKNKCKFFFHQVNQETGKIYKKYPRIKINGIIRTIERINYSLPSRELIQIYENKKAEYLKNSNQKYQDEMESIIAKKTGIKSPTDQQIQAYKLMQLGHKQREIANMLGKGQQTISRWVLLVEYWVKKTQNQQKI